jgi:hypothetical protein
MAKHAWRLLVLRSVVSFCATAWAAEHGYFGFGLDVGTKGFFLSPEITSLKIASVGRARRPSTPASAPATWS